MPIHADQPSPSKQPFAVSRACCGQCGRHLRSVPFALNNIMCRECYGMDRYRLAAPTAWMTERPVETALTDEEAAAAKAKA